MVLIIIIQAFTDSEKNTPANSALENTTSTTTTTMLETTKTTTTMPETTTELTTEGTSLDQTAAKNEYIKNCKTITFKELARNPDSHKGELFKIKGEVIQVSEGISTTSLRINMTKGNYYWSDTIYATIVLPAGSDRILEDDIITIYGECDGAYTYESVQGASITLPKIDIEYFDIQ